MARYCSPPVDELRSIQEDPAQNRVDSRYAREADDKAALKGVIEVCPVSEIRQIVPVQNLAGGEVEHLDPLLAVCAVPIEAVKRYSVRLIVGKIEFHFERPARVRARRQSRCSTVPLESPGVACGVLPQPIRFAGDGER